MNGTLEKLPPFDDSLFGGATFEDLLEQAANSPNDTTVAAQLTAHVREVLDNGEVDRALEMAMVLGATACTHPHLEDLASELGEEVFSRTQSQDEHGHAHHEKTGYETTKKDKRRQRAGVRLAGLLDKYPWLSKATGQN